MIPVRKADIAIGHPLPWPVFDSDRRLLLRAGFTVESEAQLEEISRRGLFRAVGAGGSSASSAGDGGEREAKADGRGDKWHSLSFADLRLPIGTRLTVQKLDPDDDARYNARLYGVFKDVSIIINIPAPGGSLAMFRQGQPLLLRAFSGTEVFAFTADVLLLRYVPTAYLHLEYPRTVEGTEVRRTRRVGVRLIASVAHVDAEGNEQASRPAQVSDLSSGGARLITKVALGAPGDELELAFRLKTAAGEATLKLQAAIRSSGPQEDGSGHMHGVQFVRMEPLELLALEGYVAHAAANDVEPD